MAVAVQARQESSMTHPFFSDAPGNRIVYIRPVETADIPEAVASGVTAPMVYAIHDASGNRLAVLADRDAAFFVARQHEMTPVYAH
jgi:hypothetical protein